MYPNKIGSYLLGCVGEDKETLENLQALQVAKWHLVDTRGSIAWLLCCIRLSRVVCDDNASSSVVNNNTLVSKLEASDPLYLHASDSSSLTIVIIKLKGTENYKVWSTAMMLALQVKNKIGFIDGTCVTVTKIGNIRINDNVTLCDVFVVPSYCVNLMYVYKLAKDSKLTVSFNEENCYIQDSLTKNVLVTGKKLDGLYFCGGSSMSDKVGYTSCSSVNLWHARLGHPSDIVLKVLKDSLKINKLRMIPLVRTPSSVLNGKSPYECLFGFKHVLGHLRMFECLCFSTILNKSDKFGSNAEKCVFVGYSNSKKGYKLWSLEKKQFLFSRDPGQSVDDLLPNDEDPNNDFSHGFKQPETYANTIVSRAEHQQTSGIESETGRVQDEIGTNDIGDNSEGTNVEENIPTVPRRSTRNVVFRKTLNDFVIEGKVKYGLEKVINYSNLSVHNMCFASVLNKSCEPRNFHEAVNDPNWMIAINNELEALHRNDTWDLVELPPNRKTIVLLVYVDDIVLTGNSQSEILKVKEYLKTKFLIKDLGELKYFLGIEIIKSDMGLCLSQRKYCLDLLAEYGMLGCKPVSNPIEQHFIIANMREKGDDMLTNVTGYQKLVVTRPDIAYVVHYLSQFMHKPYKSHLQIALRLLSTAAISIAANPVFHDRTKHFELDLFFLRAKIASGCIKTVNIQSKNQGADVFTKGLLINDHAKMCMLLHMHDIFRLLNWGGV
ncbi:uncharacterized protein LOC143585177 [Bidens hawaiensis]|uniref:uncharacterized protein LOC143585177 n=1 Tax=Bidens hawaiensis TaxID=980011 RepID=UPI0040491D76